MVAPAVAKRLLTKELTKVLDIVKRSTADLVKQCKEYEPLTPTVFIGPDEPDQGSGFTPDAGQVAAQSQRRIRSLLRSPKTWDALVESFQWHLLEYLAPFVIASTGGSPPMGLYINKPSPPEEEKGCNVQ